MEAFYSRQAFVKPTRIEHCPVLGLSKIRSTFDQLANLHSDTLRDLAPFLCMERSNRIPMEIFRLAARNENQRTNGPVNAHRRPSCLFFPM